MKVAYLFPGQGSQFIGMGRELFERFAQHTRRASDVLGYSITRLCLEDPLQQLAQTQFTQCALYFVGALSLLAQRENEAVPPAALAGHSLGEYVALFAADVFDFETGLALVQERARRMGEVSGGGMAAVLQMSATELEDLRRAANFSDIDIANYNSPTQTVVSGDVRRLEELGDRVRAHGGQFIPLRVSAAFHSRHMSDAQEHFARWVANVSLRAPRIPVIANASAQPYPAQVDALRQTLVRQITNPVRWLDSIEWLRRNEVTQFIEVGPGKVLTRLTDSILSARREAPQPVATTPHPKPAPSPESVIILCPGQGGQQLRMGRSLYEAGGAFRDGFDECAAISQPLIGASITDVVYRPSDPNAEFSRTLHTHVANFAFSYGMIAHLNAQGVVPRCYVGWSLGEYVALAASGASSLQDVLTLVVRQALDVEEHTKPASMLAVLANVNVYYSLSSLFHGAALAGIHTDQVFVITGDAPTLERVERSLGQEDISSHRLPVQHGFHSPFMDPIEAPFRQACARVMLGPPRVPVYSSALRQCLQVTSADYLWRVCRGRFNFSTTLLQAVQQYPGSRLVDVGPSGTSASHAIAILGRGVDARHALRDETSAARRPAAADLGELPRLPRM